MTIDWILKMLKMSGINSKHIVLTALMEATPEELMELRTSINEKINIMSSYWCDICGKPISENESKLGICGSCINEMLDLESIGFNESNEDD